MKYENIRKIPTILTCGDLLDMQNSIASNLSRDFIYHECEKIMPCVKSVFDKTILEMVDKYLGENNKNNFSHDTNQFGHTPKPKTAPKKYKHILFDRPAKDIKTMKNLSRKFGEWVKYKAGDRKGGACNITFYDGDATMELSFNCDFNRIYINFYGIQGGMYDWVSCNRKDKEYYVTSEFWRQYKRRITKTIARMIREIENNSNNWEYIEEKYE